jgi:lysophospholipid acyltransferase (LPLAT)-like uncharacterized protein
VPAHGPPGAFRVRALLGLLLGLIARVWLRTLRVELQVHPELEAVTDRPWVLAFFHGKQWPLLAWRRRRPTLVMVSFSSDGELQSRALSFLGFSVVRGSSSRGGARGLAALVRGLRGGTSDAAFAVDGPRGPYGVPKPGVFLAARRAKAVIVPMGSAIVGAKTFARAWDRFALAWPFARVSVVLGAPLELREEPEEPEDAERLQAAIAAANDAAEGMLAASSPDMLRFPRVLPILSRANGRRGR